MKKVLLFSTLLLLAIQVGMAQVQPKKPKTTVPSDRTLESFAPKRPRGVGCSCSTLEGNVTVRSQRKALKPGAKYVTYRIDVFFEPGFKTCGVSWDAIEWNGTYYMFSDMRQTLHKNVGVVNNGELYFFEMTVPYNPASEPPFPARLTDSTLWGKFGDVDCKVTAYTSYAPE